MSFSSIFKRIANQNSNKKSLFYDIYEKAFKYIYQLPDCKKALILSAHPDDEVLGCGGTLVLLKQKGVEVRVVYFTDGGAVNYVGNGNVKEIRRQEAYEIADLLSIDKQYFLEFPDYNLFGNKKEAAKKIKKIVGEYQPDLIFIPSPVDLHPDHRTVWEVAYEDLFDERITCLMYEIYTPIRFNMLLDITDVIDIKEKAFKIYRNSLVGNPKHFFHSMKGLNAFRCLLTPMASETRYFEAFWMLTEKKLTKKEIRDWLTYNL